MQSIGSGIYQYASRQHLAEGGFFPLDGLNPGQATLCNLFPYWNHGSGDPIWPTCIGDQYLFPPRVLQSDCPNQNPLSLGCWVPAVAGVKHDTTRCQPGPYCGDGVVQAPQEECDLGAGNGTSAAIDGCTTSCQRVHYCGDGIVDAELGEECDLGANNGRAGQACGVACNILI